jgi:hypothetical protein
MDAAALDRWTANLAPGDPCSVWWSGKAWEAKMYRPDDHSPTVLLHLGASLVMPMVVRWDDVMPPGHVWEPADG